MTSHVADLALPAGRDAVPLHRGPHPLAFAAVPVIAVFGLLPALGSRDSVYRLVMLGLVGLFVLFVIGSVVLTRSVSEGRVRIDDAPGSLRFRPATGVWILFAATSAAMVALAIPATLSAGFEWSLPRASPLALGLVGLGFLAQQLWWLRTPVGLALSPDGLRGVRGIHPITIGWDELAAADVIDARGAKLVLHRTDGGAQPVGALWLGSDPNIVAPVIEFFRTHPEKRAVLGGEPAETLRVARAALTNGAGGA